MGATMLAKRKIGKTTWKLVQVAKDLSHQKQTIQVLKGRSVRSEYQCEFNAHISLSHPSLAWENWLNDYLLCAAEEEEALNVLPSILERLKQGLLMSVALHYPFDAKPIRELFEAAQDDSFVWQFKPETKEFCAISTRKLSDFLNEDVLMMLFSHHLPQVEGSGIVTALLKASVLDVAKTVELPRAEMIQHDVRSIVLTRQIRPHLTGSKIKYSLYGTLLGYPVEWTRKADGFYRIY